MALLKTPFRQFAVLRQKLEDYPLFLMQMDHKRGVVMAVILSLIVALLLRFFYHIRWAGPDFWGDSYHHWLISRLTLANQWIYTDYKGLETIWLPGYHYLISAVMFIWGRFDLLPAHLTNMILGTVACGLVAWLVSDITKNWLAGLGAGLTLALLPWHIAYSHLNMPEVMAGVLLLALLLALGRSRMELLPWLALVSTLTRHELTLFMGIIGVWLAWQRNWQAVRSLGLGVGLGLAGWSFWSWYRSGDALGWWVRTLDAISWDARFWTAAGVRRVDIDTLVRAANRAYPLLAVVGLAAIVLLIGIIFYGWRYRLAEGAWLLVALVGSHWLIIGRSFVAGFLPVADPRYVLISLPILTGVGVIAIAAIRSFSLRLAFMTAYALFLITSMYNEIPKFFDMDYIITPERAVGEYLGQTIQADNQDNFWVDAPVTIYYSNLDPERFFSSDTLLPEEERYKDNTVTTVLASIEEHNIRYVLWEDVSYTFVGQVWPQMAAKQAFDQNGYHFERVFDYSGADWELEAGARPTKLWQVMEATSE
jgi:hypothetical protein